MVDVTQKEPLTREELIAIVERKRLIAEVNQKRAAKEVIESSSLNEDNSKIPFVPPNPLDATLLSALKPGGLQRTLEAAQGFGNTLLNGQFMGGGDEFVGGGRALLNQILPETEADRIAAEMVTNPVDQSFAEDAIMYRDDADASKKQFVENNPVIGTTTELAAGFANPLNKYGMINKNGTFLKKAVESILRGTGEGAIAGALENNEDRLAGAQTGAKWGAGISGALTGILGPTSQFLSKPRVQQQLEQLVDDGQGGLKKIFQPINMADPESALGKFYRDMVGVSYGSGNIGKQESAYLNNAPQYARFADPETGLVVPNVQGTKVGLNDAVERQKELGRLEKERITENSEQELLGLSQRESEIKEISSDVINESQQKIDDIVAIADESTPKIIPRSDRLAVAEVVEEAIPSTMDAETVSRIKGMDNQLDQEEAITKWWNANAYKSVKEKKFKWDGGLRDEIERTLASGELGANEVAELQGIVNRINNAADNATNQGRMVVNEGSTLLDSSGKLIDPPSYTEISEIGGDAFLEIRNFFARKANAGTGTGSRSNRLVAKYFDDIIGKELGLDSKEYQEFLEFNARYNARKTLETSATSARNNARDMRATDITKNAANKSQVQKNAGNQSRKGSEEASSAADSLKKSKLQASLEKKAALEAQKTGLEKTRAEIAAQKKRASSEKTNVTVQTNVNKKEIKDAGRGVLAENPSAGNKVVATATLGAIPSMLTGGIGIGTLPAGYLTAKALSSQTGQKAVAGQLELQKLMAKAMREGDMNAYTRALSRFAALEAASN